MKSNPLIQTLKDRCAALQKEISEQRLWHLDRTKYNKNINEIILLEGDIIELMTELNEVKTRKVVYK